MKNILRSATALPLLALSAAAEGAAAAEAKPAKEPRPKQPSQNGVTRPAPGTKTAHVWDIADAVSAEKGRPALREEVVAVGDAEGLNRGTVATQYARWTEFHGVTKEQRTQAREAMKPAAEPAAE